MSRTVTKLPESVVAERDAIQPLLHDGTCTITSPRRESNIRERKRYQNRIAQRTYRKDVPLLISFARPMGAARNLCRCLGRNQKQKLLALEAVAGQSSGVVASSLTTTCTCTCNTRDSDPRDLSCDEQMWNFDPLLNESSLASYLVWVERRSIVQFARGMKLLFGSSWNGEPTSSDRTAMGRLHCILQWKTDVKALSRFY
jgi:hypothetical protein